MCTIGNEAIGNLEADLAVLGSGSGMVAAVTAAEAGVKNVIVVEKQGRLGGNTSMANAFFACESPVQQRANINTSSDAYFKLAMRFFHWDIVDPGVLRAFIDQSGETVTWLEKKGVEFEPKSDQGPRGHHVPKGLGRKLMEIVIQQAEPLGIKTILKVQGQKILKDPDGRVCGLQAVTRGGNEIEIKSKAVIIATGGFSGNTELLTKLCPEYSPKMHQGKWPYHTGDGLTMAAEAGAAIADLVPIFHIGPVPASGPWGGLANAVKAPFTVWVNKRGQRYIDESGYTTWENGNAIRMQPDMETYTMFDENMRRMLEEKGILTTKGWGKAPWEDADKPSVQDGTLVELVQKDLVKRFDTLDEAAQWIGASPDALKTTIDEYNTACDQGRDPVLAKDPQFLQPLRESPYYVVRCYVHGGETMGGIKATPRMEALDIMSNTIPGLFIASVLAHGWAGRTYPAPEMGGSAFGFALHSGRIAGKSAAAYVSSD